MRRFGRNTQGLRGAGAICVNALSVWLEYEVRREGNVYCQRFERGIPTGPPTVVGTCDADEHGTRVTWLADSAVFVHARDNDGKPNYDVERLRNRIRELAFLNRNVPFSFHDVGSGREPETYHYLRGLADFVAFLNVNAVPVHPEVIAFSGERDGVRVEVALQYCQGDMVEIYSYANNRDAPCGGTHVSGFTMALTRVLNRYARDNGFLKEGDAKLTKDVIWEGLTAIVSVHLSDPRWASADASRLANEELKPIVSRMAGKAIAAYLKDNPQAARALLEKVTATAAAQAASRTTNKARKP